MYENVKSDWNFYTRAMCFLHLIQILIKRIGRPIEIIEIDNVIRTSKKQQQQDTPYNSRFLEDMTGKWRMLSRSNLK